MELPNHVCQVLSKITTRKSILKEGFERSNVYLYLTAYNFYYSNQITSKDFQILKELKNLTNTYFEDGKINKQTDLNTKTKHYLKSVSM